MPEPTDYAVLEDARTEECARCGVFIDAGEAEENHGTCDECRERAEEDAQDRFAADPFETSMARRWA